ncbi:MAG: hypothetical protein ACXWLF_08485 [Myxococcaceae bacterium]
MGVSVWMWTRGRPQEALGDRGLEDGRSAGHGADGGDQLMVEACMLRKESKPCMTSQAATIPFARARSKRRST